MTEIKTDPDATLIDKMGSFSKDPIAWLNYSFDWGSDELKDHQPEEWQLSLLSDIRDGLKTVDHVIQTATSSGHGVGKSALVSWIILWSMSTRADTRGVVTANTDTQLRTKTWPELTKWYNLFIARHWFTLTATSIYSSDKEHEKTWRFDLIPWSEHKTESFAGLHNKGKRIVIIFDEASAIADKIWEVTEGALTDENTQIIWCVFGNPTRNTGRFKDCFTKHRELWKHRKIDSRDVKITNKTQINKWLVTYGDDSDFFRVRVKGDFPRASINQFIPSDIVEIARGRHLASVQYNFAAVIIGVDRAWSGDDTIIYLRQGLMCKRLARIEKLEDDFIVAGHIARFEDEYSADAVFIDFGYGTGIYSAGKQMGRKWQMVNFGSKANDAKYANKRTEMWGELKDWLAGGAAIPDDQDLVDDLIGPEAYAVSNGKNTGAMILEAKEDMRSRGLASPDDGDALALTFAFPVLNKSQKNFNKLSVAQPTFNVLEVNKQKKTEPYNPLSPIADARGQSWRDATRR